MIEYLNMHLGYQPNEMRMASNQKRPKLPTSKFRRWSVRYIC